MVKNIYEIIFNRHKSLANPCYVNVFAGDDRKKQPKIYSSYVNLHEKSYDFLKNEIETYNTGSYGIFMNFNLLEKPHRNHENISKILFVFIDLDDAKEEHNDLIKVNLESKGIKYCYNAKSGHGYHFLVPVLLDPNKKKEIKGFLTYLKNNVCDKVDIATHTNERLLRCPESLHNKDEESKQLITLELNDLSQEQIEENNILVLKYQEDDTKINTNNKYLSTLVKQDIFFSTILENKVYWSQYYKYLDESKDRNNNFIKNLGFFLNCYPQFKQDIELFLNGWEKSRFLAVLGWAKKGQENNFSVNYYELLKWSNDNKIEDFITLLKEQTKIDVLDEYEVYYLEDEKKESCYLLYYPQKDYYVQKSINELLINLHYDLKDRGLDLEKIWHLDKLDKWEEKSHGEKQKIILNTIFCKLDKENRVKKVYNIGYEPTDNKFIHYENKVYFNTYKKTSLWDYYKKQDNYNFPKIKELLLNLCNNSEEYYLYFCKWLAWQVKNPDIKLPTAIILQGKQGSGKGTLKDLILDNLFGSNCQEINQTHLESSFNEYLLGKQIIVANEVMHNENRQTLPNILKNIITDKTITISRKFKKEIVGRNYTHWIFCTNSDNPIKIDEDDRRYSVFYSQKLRKGLGKELRENLDYELKEFICYLKDLEVVFEEVSEPIMTDAKAEIIDLNKDSVEKFAEFLKQFRDFEEAFISVYGNPSIYYVNNNFGDGEEYILTDKIYLLYEKYCEIYKERGIFMKQNFSKRLSNKGVKPLAKWNEGRTLKMYLLKDLKILLG